MAIVERLIGMAKRQSVLSKTHQSKPAKVAKKKTKANVSKRDDVPKLHTVSPESRALWRKLKTEQPHTPQLSGGDIDAAWEDADVGDETVGGTVATPDQDRVDELGRAVGLTYQDDEPLNVDQKLAQRDRQRWELNPASATDDEIPAEDLDEEDLEADWDGFDDLDEGEELEEENL
jgi:hypothetical protein